VPIGNTTTAFNGTLDGQGYVISNIAITGNITYAGLFGYASNATIKNVGMEKSLLHLSSSAGRICGVADGTTINNCYNTVVSNTWQQSAGGICGIARNGTTISNCYNKGSVIINSLGSYVGGICSEASDTTISNCFNTGAITANLQTSAGGICGYASNGTTLSNCYNTGDVYSMASAGGICGAADGVIIRNCYNTGSVGPIASTGGICGIASGTIISNCYNTGTTSTSLPSAGGICGDAGNGTTIRNCYGTGAVTSSIVGGILGTNLETSSNIVIEDCSSYSNLTGETVGGIIGSVAFYSTVTIDSCVSYDTISTTTFDDDTYTYFGGMVGYADG